MKMSDLYIKWEQTIYSIGLLFMLCFFVQLLGFPNKLAILGSGVICICYIITQKKSYLSIREIALFAGLFLYTYISKYDLSDIIIITSVPLMFSFVGKYGSIMSISKKNSDKIIFHLLAVYIVGFSIHGFLNSILYFREGFMEGGRMWSDIWGKVLLATHQNVYVLPVIALMFPAVIYLKRYTVLSVSVILCGVFFLYHSIHSLSRIPVMIWAICVIWGFILFLMLNKDKKIMIPNIKKIIIGFVVILIVAVFFIAINYDIIKNLAFVQRMTAGGGILHNIRFRAQMNVIRQLFDYPFGGYQMDLCGLKHCHNVWLDIANAAGLIPFGLMVVYTIISVIDIITFLRNGFIRDELKFIVSGLYVSLILYYMVEPALMADVKFFVPWTFLNGIVCGCNLSYKSLMQTLN